MIAAIGFASPDDKQRVIAAGFNACISIGALDVINAIIQVLHDSAKRAA